ncbi:hypothetical protein SLS60_005956 [Paraconiothyrium brasiliense]|uniref:Uncharacterized protein n=1 Tax=Paraconiothyrium brasiliense TaxID=300254 RepID=A0ABR3RDN0_9PLEO
MSIHPDPLHYQTVGNGSADALAFLDHLPGMDVGHALKNLPNGYASLEKLYPEEQQELQRLRAKKIRAQRRRAKRDKADASYRNLSAMNRRIRFGVPSMYRTGAHRTMGDRDAYLNNWDHRTARPHPAVAPSTQSNTVYREIVPAFSNLRIGEQNTSASHERVPMRERRYQPGVDIPLEPVRYHRGQVYLDDLNSPDSFIRPRIGEQSTCASHEQAPGAQTRYQPGMEVDHDRVHYHMGQMQLDDLYSPNSVRQHSSAYSSSMLVERDLNTLDLNYQTPRRQTDHMMNKGDMDTIERHQEQLDRLRKWS